MRIWGLAILLLTFWSIDMWAVRVWRSEAAVWAQAYRVAPRSFRAATNHAKHLFAAGQEANARRILEGHRWPRD